MFVSPASADPFAGFEVSPSLQGRVEFWKLVFTKYGRDDAIFHHRSYPEIIYSILDFSDFRKRYNDRQYKRERSRAVKKEVKTIQNSLLHLSKGKAPRNALERRIVALFENVGANTKKDFQLAARSGQVRSQTGIKERFASGIRRSGRYMHAIESIFKQAGLPPILGRLPLVESSFDYRAYSSVGAAGIWQFTRSTGRSYMRVNRSIDERRDPIKATRAAAKYLKNSYKKLKSWPLAVTSYNHGLSGVMRGVKQTGSRDLGVIVRNYKSKTFGFASSNFYAEFIAAAEVELNSKRYFPGVVKDKPIYFDEVKLGRSYKYKTLLRASGLSEKKFRSLNRAMRKRVLNGITSVPKGFTVKVPKGMGKSFASSLKGARLKSFHAQNESFSKRKPSSGSAYAGSSYRVRKGDTIGRIARRHGVSQKALMRANKIRDPRKLRSGQKLIIPGGHTKDPGRTKASRVAYRTYTVKKGDSLTRIAKKHGASLKDLRRLNPKLKNTIYPGQKIKVP